MSRDSNLVIDDRQGAEYRIEYRDMTSGEVRWIAIKRHGNHLNRYRNNYLVYDTSGNAVKVLNSLWEVGVFIAEQEGTYANHYRMLECVGTRTVKVTAPWATDDEKRTMALDYVEKILGRKVAMRKSKAVPPSVYYKVHHRVQSVVHLTEGAF